MDNNPLITPNKIQRLMHLAEDKSFNMPRRLLLNDDDVRRLAANQRIMNKTLTCESSSGLLDLEKIEGFGESRIGDLSLSVSTAFNPREMTGRSTGTDNLNMGRHSLALENITNQMDKQTTEIEDIMRHSIATDYSMHAKPNLTADEASLIVREAPLPVQNLTQTNITETSLNNSELSMGSYFKKRTDNFTNIFNRTDSPVTHYMPNFTQATAAISASLQSNQMNKLDQTLDSVPVRQPRSNVENKLEKQNNLMKANEIQANHAVQRLETLNEPCAGDTDKQTLLYISQMPDKPKYVAMNLNTVSSVSEPSENMGHDDFLMKLQHSLRIMNTDDTEGSTENSLSISKIADYLGKQSNISVTDMLHYNKQNKHSNNKQPLTELHVNLPGVKRINRDVQVTHLKDSKRCDTASSSDTATTVISPHKCQPKELCIPEVIVTQLVSGGDREGEVHRSKKLVKSPSNKSHSTLSTIQENLISFKSDGSPVQTNNTGKDKTPHVPSPNIKYKELDNSVDWDDIMQQKSYKQESMAKEKWVEILATEANGYVGVNTPVTVTVTTLADSWLTAKLQFVDLPDNGRDLTIDLPRNQLLLSPGKCEKIIFNITSNVELQTTLHFTMSLKDPSIDAGTEQHGEIKINLMSPAIQAMSCDGINKVTFMPIQEKASLAKSFVLISDCPEDLQLALSIVEGESMFAIVNVQEIKKSDVNKVLMDRPEGADDGLQAGRPKNKARNKQLCRLTAGNAIRVTVNFIAPLLSELQITQPLVTFKGALNVNLIGVSTVLRDVALIGTVGTVNLMVNAPSTRMHLTQEPVSIDIINDGSLPGAWVVKFKTNPPADCFPFKIAPSKFEIRPGCFKSVALSYVGTGDSVCKATVIFVETASGKQTSVEISGGEETPRVFPIKTNYSVMSWVRSGRKELSLKNATNRKIYIRCQIFGEGFSIDLPRESRGVYCLPFGACECRPLPIVFTPTSSMPHAATLHIVYDRDSDFSRKIPLYGCAGGEAMRWSGRLFTYGDTALVRAVSRAPITLELYNKSTTAAFVCARVHFNLQYMCVERDAEVVGARQVVRARARHSLALRVEWARVERRARDAAPACSLATVSVLTGAELTRRRILRIVRNGPNGELDTTLLPDHLKVLADEFEGEDPSMDNLLEDFKETKVSLDELIGGLQELTAQVDLPADFTDENTIIISDDTVIEHHTLCG